MTGSSVNRRRLLRGKTESDRQTDGRTYRRWGTGGEDKSKEEEDREGDIERVAAGAAAQGSQPTSHRDKDSQTPAGGGVIKASAQSVLTGPLFVGFLLLLEKATPRKSREKCRDLAWTFRYWTEREDTPRRNVDK